MKKHLIILVLIIITLSSCFDVETCAYESNVYVIETTSHMVTKTVIKNHGTDTIFYKEGLRKETVVLPGDTLDIGYGGMEGRLVRGYNSNGYIIFLHRL